MITKRAAVALALLAWTLPSSLAHSQQAKLNEVEAGKLLVRKVQVDALYASWTTIECLRFIIEDKTTQHFDFAVRERHDAKCPGDPAVEPIVDRFRVHRGTRRVFWYEPASGNYVAYVRVKQQRAGGR